MTIRPRVVGLDLSMTATGLATTIGHTVTIKPRGRGDARLCEIRDAIVGQLTEGVEFVVVEDLPTHAKAAGITGMVHGVVRAALNDLGVPYITVPPATLKKYATGAGNADKTKMAVSAIRRADREFGDDNQCDAAWLRWLGLDLAGVPEFPLPASHRAILDKLVLPVEVRTELVGESVA